MNKLLKSLSAFALPIVLLGCGAMSPIRVLDPNSPAMQINGFKVIPPQRAGWQFSSTDSLVGFYRLLSLPEAPGASENEPQTFVITVETLRAASDDIATVDGLIRYTGRFSSAVSPERRQRLVEHKLSAYRDHGTDCVSFNAVVEEQPRKSLLEIRGAGFVCRHPSSSGHVVRGMYSERHAAGVQTQSSEPDVREAENVLKSVEFMLLRH